MEHDNNRSEDRETRAVLALASTPDIPGAAMDRLMAPVAIMAITSYQRHHKRKSERFAIILRFWVDACHKAAIISSQ